MTKVTAARARVFSQEKGIGMKLELTVTPDANIAVVTQEASRVVVETLQADLGLPVSAPPSVRILFGPPKTEPVASSVTLPPTLEPPPEPETGRPESAQPGQPTPPPPAAPPAPEGEPPPASSHEAAAPEGERPQPGTAHEPPPQTPGPEEPPAAEGPPRDEPQQH